MRLLKLVSVKTEGAGVGGGGSCSTVSKLDSRLKSAGFASLWPLGH